MEAAGSAQAATINVPADYGTIQAAINAAPAGSTIYVAAGTYNENLSITKSLNLIGAGASATHVNALIADYTLKIKGNGSPVMAGDVLIDGFTFEDTNHLNWCIIETDHIPVGKRLTFRNNVIANGDGYGWWDYHSHSHLDVTGCTFINVS